MGDQYAKIRVAAVQAAPVFLNREKTVEKASRLIKEAAAGGAKMIGFSEGFIPGHPLWYHFHPATSAHSTKLATELFKNSVEIPSSSTETLCEAAREANAYVVMGLCERRPGTFGTMYNTQLFIDDEGNIIGIITKNDLFKAMISLTGLSKGGVQFGFLLEDSPGSIKDVTDIIRHYNGNLASILSSYEKAPQGYRHVYIRAFNIDREKSSQLLEELKSKAKLLYMVDLSENKREIYGD